MEPPLLLPIIIRIVVIILLLIGTSHQPIGYYSFLRFVVFAASVYFAYRSLLSPKRHWLIVYTIMAVTFNPFIKIYLEKSTWQAIDVATSLILVASIFTLRKQNANGT